VFLIEIWRFEASQGSLLSGVALSGVGFWRRSGFLWESCSTEGEHAAFSSASLGEIKFNCKGMGGWSIA